MHPDVQIRCQRCGTQMELKDPGPNDPWPPQQFWDCPDCGRHFWTTYPPPKKPAAAKADAPAKPTAPPSDAAPKPADPKTPTSPAASG